MVTATEPVNTSEHVEQLRQQYESAGLNPMIAASAAQVKRQQQTGGPVDEIDQQIMAFADQALDQQQALESLSAYQQRLGEAGIEQASAEYAGVIPYIQDLDSAEAVEARQVMLAAELMERGVEPQTSDELKAQASVTRLASAQVAQDLASQDLAFETSPEAPQDELAFEPELSAQAQADSAAVADLELQMLNDAQILMDNAREAGLLAPDQTTLEGGHYRITQQGGVTVIEGDGKRLIADNGDILRSEGFGAEDYERFNRLGQRRSDELAMAVSQSQESPQQQERSQREHQRQIQRGQRMELT